MFHCSLYEDYRVELFDLVRKDNNYFDNLDDTEKLCILMQKHMLQDPQNIFLKPFLSAENVCII